MLGSNYGEKEATKGTSLLQIVTGLEILNWNGILVCRPSADNL